MNHQFHRGEEIILGLGDLIYMMVSVRPNGRCEITRPLCETVTAATTQKVICRRFKVQKRGDLNIAVGINSKGKAVQLYQEIGKDEQVIGFRVTSVVGPRVTVEPVIGDPEQELFPLFREDVKNRMKRTILDALKFDPETLLQVTGTVVKDTVTETIDRKLRRGSEKAAAVMLSEWVKNVDPTLARAIMLESGATYARAANSFQFHQDIVDLQATAKSVREEVAREEDARIQQELADRQPTPDEVASLADRMGEGRELPVV